MIERPVPAPTHMAVAIVPFQVSCDSLSSVGSSGSGLFCFGARFACDLRQSCWGERREEEGRGNGSESNFMCWRGMKVQDTKE